MYVKLVLAFGLGVLILAPQAIIAWFLAAVLGYIFLKIIGG
jgi:hypothetical protein